VNLGLLIIGSIITISVLATSTYILFAEGAQPIINTTDTQQGNFTGSIEINSVIRNAFDPLIEVSLSDAASSAQEYVGGNTSAIASFIHPSNGYLVYMTYILDENNQVTKVITDAGNGKILDTHKMSIEEFMNKFHQGKQSMQGSMNMHGQMGQLGK
jgi:hypothetical protein